MNVAARPAVIDAVVRPAGTDDAARVAQLLIDTRARFMPYAPSVHRDDELREWVATTLLPSGGVLVAMAQGQVVGAMATVRGVDSAWITQMAVDPALVGRGLGSVLLAHALTTLPWPIRLYTFQANGGARRFYERHGFTAIAFSDGRDNEERCPDVLYELGALADRDRPPVLAHQRFAADRAAFQGLDLRARFEHIHATNLWGAATSASGLGSELPAVAALAAGLPPLLHKLGARSLLDAPCGDALWIHRIGLDLDYVGADIVPAIIGGLQRRAAAGELKGRYLLADITSDPLPRADAVLCRDCLVHLSFENIFRAFNTVRRSGARYLLTTTFLDHEENADIVDGDWRILNLEKAPFNLPAPVDVLIEGCREGDGAYADKALGLWDVSALPAGRGPEGPPPQYS